MGSLATVGTAAQGGVPRITMSIDNPAARMEATSWSSWDQSYEVGPPYWIHAQSAPIRMDVIPMLLMLASHAACVAGVCVSSAGRLIPNTGPPVAPAVDFTAVVVGVVVVAVAVVGVVVVGVVVVGVVVVGVVGVGVACDVE
jgi:hypothetical protein